MTEERWLPVVGYEGRYLVSDAGHCRGLDYIGSNNSKRKGQEMKPHVHRQGYIVYWLSKAGERKLVRAHRLVAEAFIPNPSNLPQVNHKDGIKSNNRWTNLEWTTNSGNQIHAYATGLREPEHREKHYDFKGAVWVFDSKGNHVDTLVGAKEMRAKGYEHSLVYACLNGRGRTRHRGMTFKRQSLSP